MGDRYDAIVNTNSSPENDSISILLHQFLFRTPSSIPCPSPQMQSPTHFLPDNQQLPHPTSLLSHPVAGPYFPTIVCSASAGVIDNDPDDYDYENEEGFEALMEETTVKHNSRNSSKRSRAAEVHNLSEKRRRSRINEKMKALQNLIPNSNKTDKASMLDEAIEYLKQLQLQVQMLTMRNGLSLYPMCQPDAPNQPFERRISFHEGYGPLNLTASMLPNNPSSLANSLFSLAKQCNNLKQPSATNMSNTINSKPSYGVASSIQAQHGSSELHICPEKEFCREDMPYRPLNMDHSATNLGVGIPFELQASGLSENKVWGV